ncbi:MAG: hypothetical protein AAF078_04575 [Planctomycetota bacterium]
MLDLTSTVCTDSFSMFSNADFDNQGSLTLTDAGSNNNSLMRFNGGALVFSNAASSYANGGVVCAESATNNSIRGNFTNGLLGGVGSPNTNGSIVADGGDITFSQNGSTFANTVAGTVTASGTSAVGFSGITVDIDGGTFDGTGDINAIGNSTVVYRQGNVTNPIRFDSGTLDLTNAAPASGDTASFRVDAPSFQFQFSMLGDIPAEVDITAVDGSFLNFDANATNHGSLTLSGPSGVQVQTTSAFGNSGDLTFEGGTTAHQFRPALTNNAAGTVRATANANADLRGVVNNGRFDINAGSVVQTNVSFDHSGGTLELDGDLNVFGAAPFRWTGGDITTSSGVPTVNVSGFNNFPGQLVQLTDGRDASLRIRLVEDGGAQLTLDDSELSDGQIIEVNDPLFGGRQIRVNTGFVNKGTIETTGSTSLQLTPASGPFLNQGLLDFDSSAASSRVRHVVDGGLDNGDELALDNAEVDLVGGGAFTQIAIGTLSVNVRGSGANEADLLRTTGAVNLAGALDLSVDTSTLAIGDVVTLVVGGVRNGTFDTIQGVSLGSVGGESAGAAVTYTAGQARMTVALLADANLDGAVNTSDLAILAGNFDGTDKTWTTGDYNGDGVVNTPDLAILAGAFGTDLTGASIAAAVPEPGALGFIGVSVTGLIARRRSVVRLG